MVRYHMRPDRGEALVVELREDGEGLRVRVADREVRLETEVLRPGELRVRLPDRWVTCHYACKDRTVYVWLEGRSYRFEVGEGARPADAPAGTGHPSRITAPMPGNVRKVMVEAGQAVEPHQPLVVLESMKMEITLAAPRAGQVERVLCREGEMVEMGALLVALVEDAG